MAASRFSPVASKNFCMIEKLVWLREDNMQPVYAELFADGTRELSIRFTSYQENGG